ncbi:hypothetical protein GOBAR_AA06242 [Gossypium barbadense]|uniref:VAN3-binding protein-like auxin canalisation domain-containing protein n=1 Tax=Gossypium barbadense TaxID=3634 RepID=A0A2P5YFH5_GOSBA|nr:hypothetical protein GOBAR_AA06242 [Gossypium barbadense]
MEEASPRTRRRPDRITQFPLTGNQLPESPRASSSSSSTAPKSGSSSSCTTASIPEDTNGETEELDKAAAANLHFSFSSSATSQLVLERIMSQSEVSPLTSGRLSHSSGPLISDSPPVSPSEEFDDVVKVLYNFPHSSSLSSFNKYYFSN